MRIDTISSPLVVNDQAQTGAKQQFDVGQKIAGKVIKTEDGNVAIRMQNGTVLNAKHTSDVSLAPGQNVELVVSEKFEGSVVMRLTQKEETTQNAAVKLLADMGLEPNKENVAFAKISMQMGVQPRKDVFEQAMRNMSSLPGINEQEAFFLASNKIPSSPLALQILRSMTQQDSTVGKILDGLINALSMQAEEGAQVQPANTGANAQQPQTVQGQTSAQGTSANAQAPASGTQNAGVVTQGADSNAQGEALDIVQPQGRNEAAQQAKQQMGAPAQNNAPQAAAAYVNLNTGGTAASVQNGKANVNTTNIQAGEVQQQSGSQSAAGQQGVQVSGQSISQPAQQNQQVNQPVQQSAVQTAEMHNHQGQSAAVPVSAEQRNAAVQSNMNASEEVRQNTIQQNMAPASKSVQDNGGVMKHAQTNTVQTPRDPSVVQQGQDANAGQAGRNAGNVLVTGNYRDSSVNALVAKMENLFAQLKNEGALKPPEEGLKEASKNWPASIDQIKSELSSTKIGMHQAASQLDGLRAQNDMATNFSRFAYVQIPVNLNDNRQTAELYVLRRDPNKGKLDAENATILLALDTENMGKVETLIKVEGKNVTLKFKLDEVHKDEIKMKTLDVYNSLREKGFRLADMRVDALVEPVTPLTAEAALLEDSVASSHMVDFEV